MSFESLSQIPEGVAEAAAIIAGLDGCFHVGFGRLGPEQTAALESLGRVCATTPLAVPVQEAIAAVTRNEFVDKHFAALAAARAALQGAQHDALRAQALRVLGRPAPPKDSEAGPINRATGPLSIWQESTRHWLMEIAIAGFGQLEPQTLAPFSATLEQLQGEPTATRLAALLTGFQQELLRAMPIVTLPHLPLFRWMDLWTRSMVGCLAGLETPPGAKVSGTLKLLGLDLRSHRFFLNADVYGVLEENGTARLVRIPLSSYKVDVVQGTEAWRCFGPKVEPLWKALVRGESLKIEAMPLQPTGDLIWTGEAKAGAKYSRSEVALQTLAPGVATPPTSLAVAARDRHPVQIAEPIALTGYKVDKKECRLVFEGGFSLPVAVKRMNRAAELQPEQVKKSTALFGLLRFDGGAWSVQPLAVTCPGEKPAEAFVGSGACEPPPKKGATLAILAERASRLLRKKS